MSYFVLYCCDKTLTKKILGKEEFHLRMPRSQSFIEGTQDRNLEAGTEAETMACMPWLAQHTFLKTP